MYGKSIFSIYERIASKIRQIYWRMQLRAFGRSSFIHSNVTIIYPGFVSVGSFCSIGHYCHIWGLGGLTIEDNVLIASHCVITTQTHDQLALSDGKFYRETHITAPVAIGSNVWIGSNCTIFPGVTIGKNSIIGAGSVVTSSIPENVVAYGAPARVIRECHS